MHLPAIGADKRISPVAHGRVSPYMSPYMDTRGSPPISRSVSHGRISPVKSDKSRGSPEAHGRISPDVKRTSPQNGSPVLSHGRVSPYETSPIRVWR